MKEVKCPNCSVVMTCQEYQSFNGFNYEKWWSYFCKRCDAQFVSKGVEE